MRYLFHCTQKYIEDSHGVNVWKSIENHIEFVLTHPNGWEGPQQKQIRRAATLAGLVSGSPEGQDRVHLLTEGEASLHFCVSSILVSEGMSKMPIISPENPGQEEEQPHQRGVVVIDAGGGTIDLSAYSMRLSPVSFEEVAPAECEYTTLQSTRLMLASPGRLQGSVLVTRRAAGFLKSRYQDKFASMLTLIALSGKLEGSKYGGPEFLKQMTEIFDKTTKLRLRNAEDPQYIKFGTVRDKDPQYDIRSGQLRLAG